MKALKLKDVSCFPSYYNTIQFTTFKMPFNADLRVGVGKYKLNMSWVYEMLTEHNIEIEFQDKIWKRYREDGLVEEKDEEYHRTCFEQAIEQYMSDYIEYTIFGHGDSEKYENYPNDVWGYIHDKVLEYPKEFPEHLTLTFETE